jgi:hypothetical protein
MAHATRSKCRVFFQVPKRTISVASFGNEWNHFNFDGFKANWLNHIAEGAFGSTDYFKDKLILIVLQEAECMPNGCPNTERPMSSLWNFRILSTGRCEKICGEWKT